MKILFQNKSIKYIFFFELINKIELFILEKQYLYLNSFELFFYLVHNYWNTLIHEIINKNNTQYSNIMMSLILKLYVQNYLMNKCYNKNIIVPIKNYYCFQNSLSCYQSKLQIKHLLYFIDLNFLFNLPCHNDGDHFHQNYNEKNLILYHQNHNVLNEVDLNNEYPLHLDDKLLLNDLKNISLELQLLHENIDHNLNAILYLLILENIIFLLTNSNDYQFGIYIVTQASTNQNNLVKICNINNKKYIYLNLFNLPFKYCSNNSNFIKENIKFIYKNLIYLLSNLTEYSSSFTDNNLIASLDNIDNFISNNLILLKTIKVEYSLMLMNNGILQTYPENKKFLKMENRKKRKINL